MRTTDVEILIVPGAVDAGPEHWLSRWERRLTTARRVEQVAWARPDRAAWSAVLVAAVEVARQQVVLVAHGLGVATVAHAAPALPAGRVAGAFLVAPVSQAHLARMPGIDLQFPPLPDDPLPFPSLLIASRTDGACPYEDAGDMALAWGSLLVDAGDVGHLDVASGHGPWPEGAMRFGWFLKNLKTET